MFKVFNEDKGKLEWKLWVVLLIEFLGTFIMVFEIIAPSAFGLGKDWSGMDVSQAWINFNDIYGIIFGSYFMKAFWVAGFILLLIFLLRNISVNLNPAVTMSEVATGEHSWTKGLAMIATQFAAGILAGEVAWAISDAMGIWNGTDSVSTSSLDAVYPRFITSTTEQQLFGLNGLDSFEDSGTYIDWNENQAMGWGDWWYGIISYLLEFAFTFALVSSVIYASKNRMTHPFVITGTVLIAVVLGIHTNNIALNPARLMGAAIPTQIHGGDETLQYSWIFLSGEVSAVLLVFFIESKRKEKEGSTVPAIKKELGLVASEVAITRVRYEWVLAGNKQLERMNRNELVSAAEAIKAPINSKGNRDQVELDIIEHLIFGLESGKKFKKSVQPVNSKPEKTTEKLITEEKKLTPKKLSKEDKQKREAKRALAQKKASKLAKDESNITLDDIKKLKLTDVFGVGPKIQEYYNVNGLTDMVLLSKKNPNTLTKKFVNGLPALKSWTFEMKEEKIKNNINEAKFIVEAITKANKK